MSKQGLNQKIREVVERVGDPLLKHIIKDVGTGEFSENEIRAEVSAMVARHELRMKDDDIDHDWAYVPGSEWGA
jgi:hypothetical protein